MLCLGIVCTLQAFAFMLGFLVLCFYGITVCANLCVYAWVFLMLFLCLFFSISLFYFILVCFYFFKLPICFLIRKKGCGFGQMVKDLGVGGWKTISRIYYMKKIYFQFKKQGLKGLWLNIQSKRVFCCNSPSESSLVIMKQQESSKLAMLAPAEADHSPLYKPKQF